MSRSKDLVKNTFIIALGKICTQFISFLLLPFYTAILTKEQYGAVDLLVTYIQLILPLVLLQIEQAIFRFLIEKRGKFEDTTILITTSLCFVVVQSIIFSIIYGLIDGFVEIAYSKYFFINVLASIFSSCLLQIARGLGDNITYSIGSFISGFFNVSLNVLFISVYDMRAEGMMLAMFISNMLCAMYIFFKDRIYKYINIHKLKTATLKEMMKYSIPLVPNALSWWVVNASDRSIVLMFLGVSANGILAAAHKIPNMITMLFSVFYMSWTESAALHLREKDGHVFFSNIVDIIYRLFISCSIGIIAIMPFAFSIIINESYYDAYYQIPIYLYATMFNIIASLYSVVYVTYKKTDEIAKSSIIAGVINIIIHFILVKWIGLYAASISSVIAYCTMAVYRYNDVKKYIDSKLNKMVVVSSIFVIAVVSLSYYMECTVLHYFSILLAVVYGLILNRDLIVRSVFVIRKRIKNDAN